MNSSIHTLFLNPFGNFDLSLCIPGFDMSTWVKFKEEGEDDFIAPNMSEQDNYIDSMQLSNNEAPQASFKNQYRFLKNKKLLFQMTSKYQTQLNVCASFAFIQGYYHISFFAKYWFLNNTQMPL